MSSLVVSYRGANWNSNANNGVSYFNRNTVSNANTNIGGRHLIQNGLLDAAYPCPSAKNISRKARFSKPERELKHRERIKRQAYMKRIGYLYEKIYERETLELAFRMAAQGKHNKKYIQPYLDNQEYYIAKLQEKFRTQTLKLSNNPEKVIYERSARKQRTIKVPKFYPDQVVHWALCIVLKPILMKGMYKWNCGSIPNRGCLYAKKKIDSMHKSKGSNYTLKMDFSKYYPSVNNTKLYELFERKIKDQKCLWLIKLILDNGGPGLPIGYYTSQWFANFYLQELDHYVKEQLRISHYLRYIDDTVLFDDNKRKLHRARDSIQRWLNKGRYHLGIKKNWQLWKTFSRPLDFLGYAFYRDHTKMRKRMFIGLMRRVRVVKKKGYCTLSRARAIMSLLGWVMRVSGGVKYYIEHIKTIISKGEMCRIISLADRRSYV